jgi:hypothetical protein
MPLQAAEDDEILRNKAQIIVEIESFLPRPTQLTLERDILGKYLHVLSPVQQVLGSGEKSQPELIGYAPHFWRALPLLVLCVLGTVASGSGAVNARHHGSIMLHGACPQPETPCLPGAPAYVCACLWCQQHTTGTYQFDSHVMVVVLLL